MLAHRRASTYILCAVLMGVWGCGGGVETAPGSDAENRAKIDAMYEKYRADFPGVQEITAEDLAALRETEDVVIVDTRTPEERAVSRIPGSITREEFEADRAAYLTHPVVAHCTIGYRSGVYAKELAEEGVAIMNLKGSILSWVHAGEPVVDGEGKETRRVHVYGKRWDLLPEGYEGIW